MEDRQASYGSVIMTFASLYQRGQFSEGEGAGER